MKCECIEFYEDNFEPIEATTALVFIANSTTFICFLSVS